MLLNIFAQLLTFIGSLCLLLFGMNMLSDGIQKGAGSNLQKLLGKITGNRFAAVLTGVGVTAIIQSSGATTVMVVSFVNAEILTLEQAIGVIFGANIGTTVTAWIVSFFGFNFSISAAAIPLFGLGFILKKLKRYKIHNFADCFMGFALLFMGLGLLKESLALRPESVAFLADIEKLGFFGLILGVLIGTVITALIHSSSASTAIVLTMAANGSLSWQMSAAIVLGSNIGSTIDAVMSAFGASTNAKRTALVHVLFNVIGTLIALIFFKPFLTFIDLIVPGTPTENITTHIAMLHTVFNVCATLLFIGFVKQIATIARKLIPNKPNVMSEHYVLPTILPPSHISADLYGFQIEKEISKMTVKVMEMFDILSTVVNKKEDIESLEEELIQIDFYENYIDEMNDAITHFLQTCSRLPNANSTERKHFSKLILITENLENLSDECSSIMYALKKYILKKDFKVNNKASKKISEYLELVRTFFEEVCINLVLGFSDDQKYKYENLEHDIDKTKRKLKKASRHRIEAGSDVKTELAYIDLVRKIEKTGDCIYAIVSTFTD